MSDLTAWSLGMLAASALLLPVTASSNEAGFLALPLTRHNTQGLRRLNERQTGQSLTYGSANETYLVEIEIGNPKQKVQLAVDIADYVTVVLGGCDSDELDEVKMEQCTQAGAYNISASETANVGRDRHANFWGETGNGVVEYDDISIDGYNTIKNISFWYEKPPGSWYYGILGLDFGRGVNTNTPLVMDQLVDQNIIDSKSFALTLGGDDNDAGSLVFGGIDTKKFAGPLYKLPIDKPERVLRDDEYHYWLQSEGVTLDDGAGNVTRVPGFNFIPWSVSFVSALPSDIAGPLARAMGFNGPLSSEEGGVHIVDCEWRNRGNGSLTLDFPGGLNVSIPYRELVGRRRLDGALVDECYISSLPRNDGPPSWIIGPSFLRRVYAVFDQDEKTVWLAKYQNCGSEVVKFEREEGIHGQCEGGSEDSGSGSSTDENGGSGTSDDGNGGSESSSDVTQDSADNGSAGARAGVALGAVVFAAVMSLAGL